MVADGTAQVGGHFAVVPTYSETYSLSRLNLRAFPLSWARYAVGGQPRSAEHVARDAGGVVAGVVFLANLLSCRKPTGWIDTRKLPPAPRWFKGKRDIQSVSYRSRQLRKASRS